MRKIIKNTALVLLFLSLSVSTALLTYLHFFASGDRNLSGEWTANPDMTEQAAVAAFGWLQDIEAVSVSMEELETCMQGLTIEVSLTLEQTGRAEGSFRSSVLPESYEACNQAAYEAFAMVFRELVAERLRMAGYTGSADEEAIEALVTESFGMSTVAYLMACGPALLPSLEELQDRYDGSGTYEAAEGLLIRQYDNGGSAVTRTEGYIREGASLILFREDDAAPDGLFQDAYPMIYTLREARDE
ncbi:MAG: hypothetical protein NC337_05930 [Roseburia sp.]|nr:hypothetical protein [Roseburia sp.]